MDGLERMMLTPYGGEREPRCSCRQLGRRHRIARCRAPRHDRRPRLDQSGRPKSSRRKSSARLPDSRNARISSSIRRRSSRCWSCPRCCVRTSASGTTRHAYASSKFQDPNCFDPDFSDSRDLFIHGLVYGPGGTCIRCPSLYAAVGRRLGYPLKLVESKGHLFVRWDDPNGERLNIEATGQGLSCPADEHYRTWPVAIATTKWRRASTCDR